MYHTQPLHRHRNIRLITCLSISILCVLVHFIRIPLPGTPVPLIVQPLGAFISGILLGPGMALLSQLLYLLALPCTAWRHLGGLTMLWGPTSGYMWGIVCTSALTSVLLRKKHSLAQRWFLFFTLTALCIHLPGMLVLRAWHHFAGLPAPSWYLLLAQGMLPFIIGDALKALIAARASYLKH